MTILNKISKIKLQCSITVETAIVFTMMMMLLFMNMGPMFICKTSADIIKQLDNCSKKLSYLKEVELDENVKNTSRVLKDKFPYEIDIDLKDENVEGINNLINTSLVMWMLLKDNDNDNNPFSNIDYITTNEFDVYDDENGIIKYDFDIDFRQPLNVLNIVGVKQRFVLNRRAFIGSDGNRQYNNFVSSNSEAYYIARDYKDTKIYHSFKDCSYLEKKVIKKTYEEVKDHYKKCKYCIKDESNIGEKNLYITDTGKDYHIDRSCRSMTAYVTCVDKDFIEDNELNLCSRCISRKNKEGGG